MFASPWLWQAVLSALHYVLGLSWCWLWSAVGSICATWIFFVARLLL